MKHEKRIILQRQRRRFRVRNRLKQSLTRARLSVFRSHRHIYAQIIDDQEGRTLVAASTLEKELREKLKHGGDISAAKQVGELIARRALDAGITQVGFDRGGYQYHGRVAALADAARDAGLDIGPKKPQEDQTAAASEKPSKKSKKDSQDGKGKTPSQAKAKPQKKTPAGE